MLLVSKKNGPFTSGTHLTPKQTENTTKYISNQPIKAHRQHSHKHVTNYLTAETAYASLSDHAEKLGLSGVLVTKEADACFIINANKARVRCRQGSATLRDKEKRKSVL